MVVLTFHVGALTYFNTLKCSHASLHPALHHVNSPLDRQLKVTCSNLHQESSPLSGTFPCVAFPFSQCKTCKFIDSSTVISAPKFTYNIKYSFTCTSNHLIYCISCSRCGMLYIGETGRQLRTSSVSTVVQFLPTMLSSLLPDILILVVIAFLT